MVAEGRFIDQPADYVGGANRGRGAGGDNRGFCYIGCTRDELLGLLTRKRRKGEQEVCND